MKEKDTALEYLQEALSSTNDSVTYYTASLTLGRFYLSTQQIDSALHYLQQSEKSDRLATQASSLLNQLKIARQQKRWEKYGELHLKYAEIESLIAKEKQAKLIQEIEHRYQYELIKKDAAFKQFVLFSISGLLLLILLYLAFLHIRHRRSSRKKEEEWEVGYQNVLEENQKSDERLKENQQKMKALEVLMQEEKIKAEYKLSLSAEHMETYLQQKKLLDLDIAQMKKWKLTKEKADVLFHQTKIYIFFKTVPDIGRITEADVEELIKTIDLYYPHFSATISKLHIEDNEIKICYFLKANMGDTVIGPLLKSNQGAASTAKKRLSKKILGSDSGAKELREFINSIY